MITQYFHQAGQQDVVSSGDEVAGICGEIWMVSIIGIIGPTLGLIPMELEGLVFTNSFDGSHHLTRSLVERRQMQLKRLRDNTPVTAELA